MNSFQREGVKLFIKVSSFIAIPIVIALFFGKFLDKKFNTEPFIFLGLTFIAFIISLYSIWKELSKYIKKLEITENKEKLAKEIDEKLK